MQFMTVLISLSVAGASAQPYAYTGNAGAQTIGVFNTAASTMSGYISLSGSPSGLALTPDGAFIYAACQDSNSVAVVSTATNSVVKVIPVGTTPIRVSITAAGNQAWAVNQGANSVSVIDVASNTVVGTVAVGSKPVSVAFSPDGTRAYVTNLYGGSVTVIDTGSRAVVNTFSTTVTGPSGVVVHPNGNIYVANEYGNVVTVHTPSGALVTKIAGFTFPNWLAISADGTRVYATNGNAGTLSVIDTSSNSIVATSPAGSGPTTVALTTDGTMAMVTNQSASTLTMISTATNSMMTTVARVGPMPFSIAMKPPAGSSPPPPNCSTITLSAPGATFGPNGGMGSVTVNAPAGCAWTASSGAAWASITAGASGNGAGTVSFSVSPNASSLTLNGNLTIAGQTYTLQETGVPCSYSLATSSGNFSATGGPGSVSVIAPVGCTWNATSNTGWATMSGSTSGSGNGSVSFSVASNASSLTRTGTLTVAGQTYTMTQSGVSCTYSLSANSATFTSAGGPGGVNVIAPAGCAWSAGSNSAWASITSGASGTGNGTVSFSVSANNGSTTLNGSLTVAGQTFTLTETGVSCSFQLSGTTSFTFNGGPGTVNVTAPNGCSWTATSNSGWLTILSGGSGSGNGAVSFTAASNSTANTLNGSLTVAGQTFAVAEGGVACSYQLSANSVSLGAVGGSGSVNVTSPVGCNWTVTSDSPAWLNVSGTYSGTASGTVSYVANANGDIESRTGNLSIGGQSFAVSESGVAFSAIHIRAGVSQPYTDPNGVVWQPDNAPNYTVSATAISNTTVPALYQTEAWSTGTLHYQYAVPNGSFTVKLKFAEFYVTQAGARTFNILINGTNVYASFDIFSQAGGMNKAVDMSFPVTVSNGQITIDLAPVTGPAKINAIEID